MYIKKLIALVLVTLFLNSCSKEDDKSLKFYGNVDVRTVSLAFRIPGRISNIYFDEGQKVTKGEVIASLDDALYQEYSNQIDAQIKIQEARLQKLQNGYRPELINKAKSATEQKKVVLLNDEKTFKKYQKLYKSKSISQENFDKAATLYESSKAIYELEKSNLELLQNGYDKEDILEAKAQLEFLQSQKNQRLIDLNDTKLYAPASGTILTKVYAVGSIINPTATVIEMAKDDEYWVRSYISERYLGDIKSGMKAFIYTDSNPDKPYKGVVSFISPLAEFTPKSVQTEDLRTDLVYSFRIILQNHDDKIKQGMPVTIKFETLKQK